jgi:hypothetical protein
MHNVFELSAWSAICASTARRSASQMKLAKASAAVLPARTYSPARQRSSLDVWCACH